MKPESDRCLPSFTTAATEDTLRQARAANQPCEKDNQRKGGYCLFTTVLHYFAADPTVTALGIFCWS
ncbi:hypothetical protein Q8A67_024637 [Cirrhinus molitorella]|uniref:Uncharacterized protein n=1 Tax=Cirrhinus molitorella TaxID=172907 RepID=A0AA88TKC9_9TELE|nr:hypothetical protein Q8A67_024637 [Cirrhinus molitorella]